MKTLNKINIIMLCAAFIFLGFGSGYFTGQLINSAKVGSSKTEENQDTRVQIYRPQPTFEQIPSPTPDNQSIYYILKNENDILCLYEVVGEEKNLIKQLNINSQFLPQEDREKLKNGITLNSLEDGFSLIEDFTS